MTLEINILLRYKTPFSNYLLSDFELLLKENQKQNLVH